MWISSSLTAPVPQLKIEASTRGQNNPFALAQLNKALLEQVAQVDSFEIHSERGEFSKGKERLQILALLKKYEKQVISQLTAANPVKAYSANSEKNAWEGAFRGVFIYGRNGSAV